MKTDISRRKLLGALSSLPALGLLGACGGGDVSVAAPEQATESLAPHLFALTEENQVPTFRNVDKIHPCRVIPRGNAVFPLPNNPQPSLNGLTYDFGGKTYTLDQFIERNRSVGLCVVKNGNNVLERYAMGNTQDSLWTSFSATKSVTSSLIGAALYDGKISSLDDPVTKYVPALIGSAYEQNTIRHLLRMSSGVQWIEDLSGAEDSDITRMIQAVLSGNQGAIMELMRTRPRAAPPGSVFYYSTGESYVLGAIVANAVGMNLSSYLSQKIWAPFGMEKDGYWLLDSPGGLELGGSNISASLRDYTRFGMFFKRQGMTNIGRVLPAGWRDLAGHPDSSLTEYGNLGPENPLGYGYQWWSFPSGNSLYPFHEGAFTADGSFGQYIYVNPAQDVVIAAHSAWPIDWAQDLETECFVVFNKIVEMLS